MCQIFKGGSGVECKIYVPMLGCSFLWTQAVIMQLKKLNYFLFIKNVVFWEYARKAMSLHLLAAGKIAKFLRKQKKQTKGIPICSKKLLNKFLKYVKKWIKSQVWNPEKWFVLRQSTRTNNDAEG